MDKGTNGKGWEGRGGLGWVGVGRGMKGRMAEERKMRRKRGGIEVKMKGREGKTRRKERLGRV